MLWECTSPILGEAAGIVYIARVRNQDDSLQHHVLVKFLKWYSGIYEVNLSTKDVSET